MTISNLLVACAIMFSFSTIKAAERPQLFNLPNAPVTPRFQISDRVWPDSFGNASVCLWNDDKLAAFSFTIDDNILPEHQWWLDRGKEFNWSFTWFVIVHYLMENGADTPEFGTWNDFKKLFAAGHDIQSHTYDHSAADTSRPDSAVDLSYSRAIPLINQNIPGDKCITMAYPSGYGKPELAAKYYIAVRSTIGRPNRANMIDYMNTYAGVFTREWIDNLIVKNPSEAQYWRGWSAICLHDVGKGSTPAAQQAALDSFHVIMKYLKSKEDDIWVDNFTSIVLYCAERDTKSLTKVKAEGDSLIEYALSDSMADSIYHVPLSIKFRVSDNWKYSQAYQNGHSIPTTDITHVGKKFAIVKAVPDQGDIILRETQVPWITGVKNGKNSPKRLPNPNKKSNNKFGNEASFDLNGKLLDKNKMPLGVSISKISGLHIRTN